MDEELGIGEGFDFDASTAQAWGLFVERLAEVVSVIEDGASLRVGTLAAGDSGAPFVQFTCGHRSARDVEPVILMEASGNAVLDAGFQLDDATLVQLRTLGWQEPGATQHSGTTPHYWAEHVQDDCTWLAELAAATLRDVFGVQHPVFLAPDQLAEILAPDPVVQEAGVAPQATASTASPALGTVVAVPSPASREQLWEVVRSELTSMLGHEPICDDEGDFAIRVGSSMIFVRCSADAREVLVFSALVHDLEGRGRAVEVLNDLNAESRFGRFSLVKDRVFVGMSLLARPFVPEHLHEGVQIITQIADGIDDELAAKLRGRVTFVEGE